MNEHGKDLNLLLRKLHEEILVCKNCELYKTRTIGVPGEGPIDAKVMFVGESPGEVNDKLGRPFVGYGGKIFDKILFKAGLNREGVFITNTIKCWPPKNRKPKPLELNTCKAYLERQIELVNPKIIFSLGTVAFKVLTNESIKLKADHGRIYNDNKIPICATFHPNSIRYIRGGLQTIINDVAHAIEIIGLNFDKIETNIQRNLFEGYFE